MYALHLTQFNYNYFVINYKTFAHVEKSPYLSGAISEQNNTNFLTFYNHDKNSFIRKISGLLYRLIYRIYFGTYHTDNCVHWTELIRNRICKYMWFYGFFYSIEFCSIYLLFTKKLTTWKQWKNFAKRIKSNWLLFY